MAGTLDHVEKLAAEWGRPDLVKLFCSTSSYEWPLALARVTVEVAVAKAQKAAAWSAFKDMP